MWSSLIHQKHEGMLLTEHGKGQVEASERTLVGRLPGLISDVKLLAISHGLEDALNGRDKEKIQQLSRVIQDFYTTTKIYDQIRIIDATGMEFVRINHSPSKPYLTPTSELQNKADRYYFKATMKLKKGEVYVSPIDLNIEHGKVEMPYKPNIRIATPLFSKHQRIGIAIVNYNAQKILDYFQAAHANPVHQKAAAISHIELINSDGLWLHANDESQVWVIALKERAESSFARLYPDEWQSIQLKQAGTLHTEHGLFIYQHIYPLADAVSAEQSAQYSWIVLDHIEQDYLLQMQDALFARYLLVYLLCMVVLVLVFMYLRKHAKLEQRLRELTIRAESDAQIRKLSSALAQAGESIMITDRAGVIEYVNQAFTTITGFSREEALGQTPRMLKSGLQDDVFYEKLWKKISCGEVWDSKIVDRKKDGSFYPAMLMISPIFDEQREIIGFIGIQQDLSAYEDLEAKFIQAQKMEAIGTLVGGIAHDFNNSLAGITGNLYLVQRDLEDRPKALKRLKRVEVLSFRAAGIIQQLLTFARKSIVSMNPMVISLFLKETIKIHKVTLPENIQLIVDIKKSDMNVKADINQLQQVIVNLINNARDAVCEAPEPSITIKLEHFLADSSFSEKHAVGISSEFACISIIDNGEGIQEKDLEHIFEPFFTTKDVGKGTGLGLAMAYGAIGLHKGVIDVESNTDTGTCFRIYLPVLKAAEGKTILDDDALHVQGNGEFILLVDDEETIVDVGKDVLEALNYQVLVGRNGYEAIEMYKTHGDKIKLIVMDIVMPRLGGVDAASAIHEINPEAEIIFSSGYDRSQTLMNQKLPEHCLFISKPFTISALSSAIHKLLSQ
ncbi:MAG: ATP-binding protein [Mariprofundaceae bacterium]|nr:ATP-binding protein [Mariprofundaceae bacterium]